MHFYSVYFLILEKSKCCCPGMRAGYGVDFGGRLCYTDYCQWTSIECLRRLRKSMRKAVNAGGYRGISPECLWTTKDYVNRSKRSSSEFADSASEGHIVEFSSHDDAEKLGNSCEEQIRFGGRSVESFSSLKPEDGFESADGTLDGSAFGI